MEKPETMSVSNISILFFFQCIDEWMITYKYPSRYAWASALRLQSVAPCVPWTTFSISRRLFLTRSLSTMWSNFLDAARTLPKVGPQPTSSSFIPEETSTAWSSRQVSSQSQGFTTILAQVDYAVTHNLMHCFLTFRGWTILSTRLSRCGIL